MVNLLITSQKTAKKRLKNYMSYKIMCDGHARVQFGPNLSRNKSNHLNTVLLTDGLYPLFLSTRQIF